MTVPADADARTGLSDAEVAERVARGETNRFDPGASRSAWSIIRANVFTLFNGIVLACFLALFLLGRWQDALFGFSALANTVIGSVQEFRAKVVLDRLALLSVPRARVRRAGREQEIASEDVVLGDVLVLRAGDQMAADAVVLASRGLQLDESMLTGESEVIDKAPGGDVLSGSVIVGGEGEARVTRVGADAYANRVAGEARRFSLVASELRNAVNRVLRWVAWGIGPIGLLVFNAQVLAAGGYRRVFASDAWVQTVVNTIAALIAMIPLGLVLMTSIAFAVGAAKLARRQVLVNELPAVEVLARVDVICLDKTGTLTTDEIVLDRVHLLDEAAGGWEPALSWFANAPDANATARALGEAVAETAPASAAASVPFSSVRKWSAVIVPGSGTWVMGAPEMVLPDEPTGSAFAVLIADLADGGRRALALAHTPELSTDAELIAEALPRGLRPVAALAFQERVRPDAAETLAYFHAQGVGIRIISGDAPRTVVAVLRSLGVAAGEGVDARALPASDDALADLLEKHIVFGRVTPDQKRRIVLALQARGHTVAMTGDGVNDALAVKTADIGIAMGSGSPATKAVARLVLLDGRFSHLPDVVREGRQVIANIERVSKLFLTKTVYAATLAVLCGILLLEFPLLPRQLSVTDGLTIGIPAFLLAFLPEARRYVPGFLRRALSFALPAGVVIAVAVTCYTLVAETQPASEAQLRTGATAIIGVVGIWVLLLVARPLTGYRVLVAAAMLVGLVGIFAIGPVAWFFALTDPGPALGTAAGATALTGMVVIGAVRWLQARRERGRATALGQEAGVASDFAARRSSPRRRL